MAQQIKKKYIENNAVDGDKLKLLEAQSVRAIDSLGNEIDLIKLNATDQVLVNDQEVALKSDVTAEAILRQAADDSLQSQINNVLSNIDPAALDSLTEIVEAFQAADANINNTISSLGTGSNSALNQEIVDRQAADAALSTRISSLETITWQSSKISVDQSVIDDGYIEIVGLIVPGSLTVTINRLMMYEGASEDYVTTIVNGNIRITFVNDFLNGNELALSIGDNLYVKYQSV